MNSRFFYSLLFVGLSAGALLRTTVGVNADTVENDNSKFKDKVNEIFYSENSKIESITNKNGQQKTVISLEKAIPSLRNTSLKSY